MVSLIAVHHIMGDSKNLETMDYPIKTFRAEVKIICPRSLIIDF
jgi:hypothetical protein